MHPQSSLIRVKASFSDWPHEKKWLCSARLSAAECWRNKAEQSRKNTDVLSIIRWVGNYSGLSSSRHHCFMSRVWPMLSDPKLPVEMFELDWDRGLHILTLTSPCMNTQCAYAFLFNTHSLHSPSKVWPKVCHIETKNNQLKKKKLYYIM